MKKITTLVALLMATAMTFGLMATTNGAGRVIYLNAGGSGLWDQAGAKFAIWFFNPGPGTFTDFMTPVEGETGIYKATIDFNDTQVLFVRFNSATAAPTWDNPAFNVWNQTGDLTFGSNNLYTITGWGGLDGTWSTYSPTPVGVSQTELMELYANNGTIYASGNLEIFTLTGLNVTSGNGNLKGAYIVKVDGKVSKIMVK
ncbi:MAG TPA: hypothetical protein P5564_06515 [Paludibacteraceae bacterium]|nr:hypothetical protein [Paludibacteraceae bacterium]